MAFPVPKTQIVNGKEYYSCTYIYDLHSFCISFRSQLTQVRRYGKMQECSDLIYDWKKCMTAKVTIDPEKQNALLDSMTITQIKPVVNDIWEYKKKPEWFTNWNEDET